MTTSALLVVDVQNGFINSNTTHIPIAIRNLIESHHFDKMVFTRFVNNARSPFAMQLGWHRMYQKPEIELVDTLKGYAKHVFDKDTYSAITESVASFLRDQKADSIFIVGLETDACVLKSAFDSFDRGFETKVLSDLCASTLGAEYHECALKILRRNIGSSSVIISDELLSLQKQPSHR